jgi:hypothetical protein
MMAWEPFSSLWKKQARTLRPADFPACLNGQPVSLPMHKAIVPLSGNFGKSTERFSKGIDGRGGGRLQTGRTHSRMGATFFAGCFLCCRFML